MNNVGIAGVSVGVFRPGAFSQGIRNAQTGTPGTFWTNPALALAPIPLKPHFYLVEEQVATPDTSLVFLPTTLQPSTLYLR